MGRYCFADRPVRGTETCIYERLAKTRDGINIRAYAPKAWANATDERKCHVNMYLEVRWL